MSLIFKKSTAQPAFTVAAAITGTTEATQTLTCAYTVVRARAANVTVRWYRHTADDGTDPTGVLLGTGSTYVLTGTDVGNYIRAIVTAINPAGTVTSTTSYTAIITSGDPPAPPALVTPAAITGTADVNETLTVTYSFTGQDSVVIQWYSYSDENGSDPIELGTSSTQALTESEAGRWIGATITATNAEGSTATSDVVAMAGVDSWTPVAPTQVVVPAYDETGKTYIYAYAGDDLQAKLNAVQPGQVLVLQAGATWTGQYVVADKDGTDWIYIVSGNLGDLPGEGTRVAIEDAANMAKITTGTSLAHVTLRVERSAKKVRFVGVEITTGYNTPSSAQYGIVRLGDTGDGSFADEIIFDRCYIHGAPIGNNRDGIVVYDASNVAVKDCYITDFKGVGIEAHGIHVFRPKGPVRIENNRIEAAGINVFIGDSASAYGSVSQRFGDITVRGNHITKKLSWEANEPTYAGYDVIRKNCLEIKTGQRVLIEGNLIENSWPGDQSGDLILSNLVSGWANDIHIRNNVLRQGANGIYLSTSGSNPIPDTKMDRVLIENNLIYGMRKYLSGITGGVYIRLGGKATIPMKYVTIQNNTLASDLDLRATWGFTTGVAFPCVENIRIRNNVARVPSTGLFQTSTSVGTDSNDIFEAVCTGEIAMHHCLYYPTSTQVNNLTENGTNVYNINKVSSSASVDYVGEDVAYSYANWASASLSDFSLQATSAGYQSGSDGNDKGVDVAALAAAMNDTI